MASSSSTFRAGSFDVLYTNRMLPPHIIKHVKVFMLIYEVYNLREIIRRTSPSDQQEHEHWNYPILGRIVLKISDQETLLIFGKASKSGPPSHTSPTRKYACFSSLGRKCVKGRCVKGRHDIVMFRKSKPFHLAQHGEQAIRINLKKPIMTSRKSYACVPLGNEHSQKEVSYGRSPCINMGKVLAESSTLLELMTSSTVAEKELPTPAGFMVIYTWTVGSKPRSEIFKFRSQGYEIFCKKVHSCKPSGGCSCGSTGYKHDGSGLEHKKRQLLSIHNVGFSEQEIEETIRAGVWQWSSKKLCRHPTAPYHQVLHMIQKSTIWDMARFSTLEDIEIVSEHHLNNQVKSDIKIETSRKHKFFGIEWNVENILKLVVKMS
ncbi:hypothetical protein GOP47_0019420 [Adiantum capillus-veneris]|uniref:Uncharacterized protein n=1 Tax=Adiantum capillus-veneris TaxID=13818 RepID=A0A9D4UBH9_ADICA|nr:hypothetical protein GOP47_0019420 [Adiantum capillus-veneris]